MNKGMYASKHPTKELCTSMVEPIDKINDIPSRFTKVCTVPENAMCVCVCMYVCIYIYMCVCARTRIPRIYSAA